jgi:N-acetylmuramoyl-L-alanine amidase
MGYENVGKKWTPAELRTYLGTLQKPVWARSITLHHTGVPSLDQRPQGFKDNHIKNIKDYYAVTMKWKAGPHLFIDDDEIFGMSSLLSQGTHAKSFNKSSIGIEVLGNYDVETPNAGRGLACWQTAAAASRALLDWLGLEINVMNVNFHRDDPKTTKTCPGSKVEKSWVLELIRAAGASTSNAA